MILDGKTALVTGARGGIGRTTVGRFLKEVATVYAADLTAEGSLGPTMTTGVFRQVGRDPGGRRHRGDGTNSG